MSASPVAASTDRVPIDLWGKDHWSLLAYVESCCVDSADKGVGSLDFVRMRVNPGTHPLVCWTQYSDRGWKPEYGTRLRGFDFKDHRTPPDQRSDMISAHDDVDCLDDLEAAGLVEVHSLVNGFVTMTKTGNRVAAALRAHKTAGGMFAHFVPDPALFAEPAEGPQA